MDMEVLGKKLDTYRNKRGRIVNVPDELRLEVLTAWEQWKGNPEDKLENLRQRAIEKKYPFTYLHDDEQRVAKLLGAVCTPDFFLFDKEHKLSYRGRLDDSWKDATKVTRQELLIAAQILSQQSSSSSADKIALGFSIKPSMGTPSGFDTAPCFREDVVFKK